MALPLGSMRARKVGDAFHIERKLEKAYEEEEENGTPHRVIEWINRCVGHDIQPCPGVDWMTIQNYLRDGAVMCRVMNKLLAGAGMPKIAYRSKGVSRFVAQNNIETFQAAAQAYGLNKMAVFEPTDLIEGRKGPLVHVIRCMDQLGRLANQRNFQPAFEVPPPRKADYAMNDEYD